MWRLTSIELDANLTGKNFAINLSIVKLTANITFERGDFEPGILRG